MVQEYLGLVRYVLENGAKKTDRTEAGTLSLFGLQTRYDLRQGFPLLTTKKLLFDAVVRELLYGYQWRKWPQYTLDEGTGQYTQGHIDQLQQVIDTIKHDPHSRRLIVSAWNVADIEGLTRQLQRQPYPLPRLTIAPKPFFDLTFAYITLHEYVHHPFIKFPIAV
jgi:thymidylate synthase